MIYDTGKLWNELERDEGRRKLPYVDTTGNITIGVGHNLTANGLPDSMIDRLLTDGIWEASCRLTQVFPEWRNLTDARQRCLLNMAFNLGGRIARFKRMLRALEAQDYERAAREMLRSTWAKQVGDRATRLAKMMREG